MMQNLKPTNLSEEEVRKIRKQAVMEFLSKLLSESVLRMEVLSVNDVYNTYDYFVKFIA